METHGLLLNSVFFLAAAVITVPVFVRLGLGSVLGYLCAGIIVGPWVLGLITNVEDILHFSEFGVVLLLFVIGLELEPKTLWSMRRSILGSGGGQLGLTATAIFIFCWLFGLNWQTSVAVSLGLALSSTAIALQTMQERSLLPTSAGQTGFSILLFQDIAVIPIIALLPLLASSPATDATAGNELSSVMVIGILLAVYITGRLTLNRIFHIIASTRLREIFTMLSLLLVIGISVLMDSLGVSMALGAFLAGVILADSEYRHTLESDIEPFKGLLLGLFFVSVGMSIDFGMLLSQPLLFFALACVLVFVKAICLYLIAVISKVPREQRSVFAIVLSQGGEFAFVLFGIATALNIFGVTLSSQLILVVTISMILTPILLLLNDKVIAPLLNNENHRDADVIDDADRDNKVIIAGFGRFGQIVGRLLIANKITPTLIDYDPDQIALVRRFGNKAYYGDVLRSDVLHSAGADKAKLIVLAINCAKTINASVEMIQRNFPNAIIVARAIDRRHALELMNAGVELFTRETFFSGLEMGKDVLKALGYDQSEIERQATLLRENDIELLYEQRDMQSDEDAMISSTQKARDRLEQVLAAEQSDKSGDLD